MSVHYQLRSSKATYCGSSYCLSSSIILTCSSSHTYLIQSSPAISTACTAGYLPVTNCTPSIPISLIFQPQSS